jgi:4-amino-4-deoxy-L-arabinose transferase-like glycosyltransferase
MNDAPQFCLADWLCLILVVSCAAGARACYISACTANGNLSPAFVVQGHGPSRTLPGDTGPPRTEIDDLAHNVQEERWFGGLAPLCDHREETAQIAPGYPWLLGMLGRFHDRPALLVRWGQCGLGALAVLCCFLFARRVFASLLVGTIAGLLAALYPFWIVNTAELADGVLVTLLVTAVLTLGARGSQVGGAFTSMLFGLSLAALAMVRAAFLPFAVVAFVWYLARCREVRSGWFAGLLALLGFANGLAPWAVRNWQVFESPVPIADSAYLHLWMGNNPSASGATLDEKELRESLRPELLQELLAEKHQPRRYARLGPELFAQVAADPSMALGNRLDAGVCYILGANWQREHRLGLVQSGEEVAETPSVVATSVEPCLRGSLLLILVLGTLGWRLSAGWARQARLAALAALWLPLPYLLSHAEDLSGPRLPVDAVLLCYAAFAIAYLIPGFASTPEEAGAANAAEPQT